MDYDNRFFAQPNELKVVDDFGNILTSEQAKEYSERRRKDIEIKLKNRNLEQYLPNGIVVQVKDQDDLFSIIDRFVYDKDYIMYDYKITEYDENSGKSYLINHEQIIKAFVVENNKVK